MSEEQRREDLLGTTDCLEAISVFKGWKNFLFVVTVICLILLQVCFWLIDANVINSQDVNTPPVENTASAKLPPMAAIVELASKVQIEVPEDVVAKAAAQSVKEVSQAPQPGEVEPSDSNAPKQPAGKKELVKVLHIKFEHIAWLIRVCNYLLVFVSTLYCLTLLFCLKISLLGRLGGLNHISRAFLLSLVVFVLILPWQHFFGFPPGLIYTPNELLKSHADIQDGKMINIVLHYARYCGLWVIVMAILAFSQIRSIRWAKATLRRLGVI
jgi:hypothetical protein